MVYQFAKIFEIVGLQLLIRKSYYEFADKYFIIESTMSAQNGDYSVKSTFKTEKEADEYFNNYGDNQCIVFHLSYQSKKNND